MAKCIMELERIKGIRKGSANEKGNNRIGEGNNFSHQTTSQKDLAEEIGLDERQLRNFKKLSNLIPELQQMVENGSIKAIVGYKILAKMSQEEQEYDNNTWSSKI